MKKVAAVPGIQRKGYPVQGTERYDLTTEYNHPYPEWSDHIPAGDAGGA